jgi:hypothetical protein
MKCISLGKKNKRFLFHAIFYLLVMIFLNIIASIFKYMKVSTDNMPLILAICHACLIFFIAPECWFKYQISSSKIKEKTKETLNSKRVKYLFKKSKPFSIKIFLVLIIMIILDYIYDSGLIYFQKIKSQDLDLLFIEIFKFMDTLFLFIFFRVFNKTRFYKHQYISLIIIIIMGLIKFGYKIINNKIYLDFYLIGFFIILPLLDSINIYFVQKFLTHDNFSPFFICFVTGIVYLLLSIPIFGIFYFIECGDSEICRLLTNQVQSFDTKTAIIVYMTNIFNSIFYSLQHFIKFLTIDKFTVFHFIIISTCGELINVIFEQCYKFDIFDLLVTLIAYAFEILGVLVFIERLELNFCGLNKNLKKYISIRAVKEFYDMKESENEEEENDKSDYNSELNDESMINEVIFDVNQDD